MGTYTVTLEQFFNIQDRLTEAAVSAIEWDPANSQIVVPVAFDPEVSAAVSAELANEPLPVKDSVQAAARITTNEANIATNAADIATNSANISANAASIATNASDIAGNVTDIATNATDIAANSASIAGNASSIAANATDISTNATSIAANAADIANNLTSLTALITALQADVQAIEDDMQSIELSWTEDAVRRTYTGVPELSFTASAAQAGMWVVNNFFTDSLNGKPVATQIKVNGTVVLGMNVDGAGNQGDTHAGISGLVRLADGDSFSVEISHNITTDNTPYTLSGSFKAAKLFD